MELSPFASGIGRILIKQKSNIFVTQNIKSMKKMDKKSGKSFPDVNKDGKVTKKDVLIAKGVIKPKSSKKK